MAALTKDRNTTAYGPPGRLVPLKVKGGVIIYHGAQVAVDATGFAVPAAPGAGLTAIGVSLSDTVSTVGQPDGAQSVDVRKGGYLLNNNPASPVVQATIGKACQVLDDNTVQVSTAAGAVNAGIVDFIDPTGQIGVFFA